MKFTLNAISLALGVVVLWTAPVHSFSNARRKLVLDVMANDKNWMKHLNVGIKFKPKTLSAAAREVLTKLKVIKAMSKSKVDPASVREPEREPEPELEHEQVPEHKPEPELEHEQVPEHKPEPTHEQSRVIVVDEQDVVVAKALHIVVDVASVYNKHSMALDFALDAIATAIKCNTLMYILVQLKTIKDVYRMQNEIIKTQPQNVWDTLIQVLDKVAVLKDSIKDEFDLYRQWAVVTTQVTNTHLPTSFSDFEKLVEKMLGESCELNQIERIEEHIKHDHGESWNKVESINTFTLLQRLLKQMFEDMPISTMDVKVWEHFLNKREFLEPTETPVLQQFT
ncbi:hypothetical protein ACI65C_001650 [Semiaphis heraclei]